MRRGAILLAGACLAFTSSLALAGGPEDLLPPIFRDPPPQSAPTPSPAPTATRAPAPSTGGETSSPAPSSGSGEVVQPIPSSPGSSRPGSFSLPPGFPSLAELEAMDDDEANAILGLRPEFDIPVAARRAVERVGIISQEEGGFPSGSLRNQPARLVGAALQASAGPVVSRWGHILLRRALASRLHAPEGMNPVTFAALRARALIAMGEGAVARTLVQDIDGSEYNPALAAAAFDAYLATGDVLGMCPVARLQGELVDTAEWELLQAICASYAGDTRSAERQLQRALGTGVADEIDVRLAQRYAGASAESARAVDIEWDGVESLSPWRYAVARALGQELPEALASEASSRYAISDVLIPATPLLQRVEMADTAAARGVLSSGAMVDLYSQLWASERYDTDDKTVSASLREAYVASSPSQRLAAMQGLWDDQSDYGRMVLTAYAAARFPVDEQFADNAARLISSMLTAGLDRNAMRWAEAVPEGSQAWALLALANPQQGMVDSGDVDNFLDEDSSTGTRKSAFLVAGLAGLGRLDDDDFADFSESLGVNYLRRSAWSDKIDRAGQLGNPTLVALLAGLGMQGTGWDQMTPRHLYHIVRALDAAGLDAEARMIAAEAVARG